MFLYRRNNEIELDLRNSILYFENVPFLAPELVLLYKSSSLNIDENMLDFKNVLAKMDDKQRSWLKNTLNKIYSNGHQWIECI